MPAERAVVFLLTSLAGAGSQRKTVNLVNKLAAAGHRVHLCYLDRKEDLLAALPPGPNLRVDCLDRRGRFDRSAMRRFREILRRYDGGTLFAVNPYPVFFATRSLGPLRPHFELVAATNTYTFANTKEAVLFHLFQKRAYRQADRVLFGAMAQRDRWCREYAIDAARSSVIYNGVDVDRFSPDTAAPHGEQGALRLVMIASLVPNKRHVDLLEAMRIVLAQGQEVVVTFVGKGPLLRALEDRVAQMGLVARVTFAGFCADVRPHLRQADVSVLASNSVETFSNAILESMAMGVAVIASNIGGAAEQITHGESGMLYEPGNVAELALCIGAMNDPRRRKAAGEACRRVAVEQFGLDRMVDAYEKIIG